MAKQQFKENQKEEQYSFRLFYYLEHIWQDIRTYFHNNDTLFDIGFILTYFLIQFGLVLATFIFRNELELLPYIVSFFALFLLTTVGIHRLFMESKNRFIKEQNYDFLMNYNDLQSHYELLVNEYNSQVRIITDLSKDNEILSKENSQLKQKLIRKKS